MNSKILNCVVANNDTYCWKDLSCTYRPWMTAFHSFGQLYEEAFLLLISYVAIYVDNKEEKKILDFVEYYNEYISDFMGITIRKHTFHNQDSMVSKVVEMIDQEQPILVPCDLIALPYNPMYLLEHRYKCMIIKGYDLDRNLYYILDNIHIDYGSSTILTDFVSNTCEMYNMNKEIAEALNYEQCIFSLEKNEDSDIREYTILKKLGELLSFVENNGTKVIHWEKELIRIKQKENNSKIIEEIIKTLDFKFVFHDILYKLLIRITDSNKQVHELCDEYSEISKGWTSIRNQILYKSEVECKNAGLEKSITELEELELAFMNKLKKFICELPDKPHSKNRTIDRFRLLSNSHAELTKISNGYRVVHSNANKYDTWLMQDNAFQLLIDNVIEGSFETKIKYDTCLGEDIHSGIIIKMKSGKKYLYGNVRGRFIAIYCPERGEKFELYTMSRDLDTEYIEDKFKISIVHNKIDFYYMNHEECIFSLYLEEEIESIGLFSKTWEYLNHSVLFYDIKEDISTK